MAPFLPCLCSRLEIETIMKPIFDKQLRTEKSLYARMRPIMERNGVLIRVENIIVPGLPDCIYIYDRKIILIEIKVLRNGKISMPKFQYSRAMEMLQHINPMHHWYWVSEDDGFGNDIISAYLFKDLSTIVPEYIENAKIIKMDIREATPRMVFKKTDDLADWYYMLDNERNHQ